MANTYLVLSVYRSTFKPADGEERPYAKAWVVPYVHAVEPRKTAKGENLGVQPIEVSISPDGDYSALLAGGLPGIYDGDYDLSEYNNTIKRKFRNLTLAAELFDPE
jgi:hypothetical protein